MERKRIYLCLAHMSEDGMEQKYVKEAFDTNWVVPLGPNVNGFEKDLEEFVNSNDNVIYPDKVRLNCYYYRHYSFIKDIQMILCTVLGKNMKYAGEVI